MDPTDDRPIPGAQQVTQPLGQTATVIPTVDPVIPVAQNLVEPKKSSRFKLKVIIPALISIILVFSTTFSYFFVFVPKAQAKEFVEETSKDLTIVQDNVKKAGTDYSAVSNSFEISKGAFFEISNIVTYKEAKVDTNQDVADIKDTIVKIKAAKENKEKLNVPGEVEELDKKLDSYYDILEKSMVMLLEYEEFQLKMLDAVGDEYENEFERFPDAFKSGNKRTDVVEYLKNLVRLSDASSLRLKNIGVPPADQKVFYDLYMDGQNYTQIFLKQVLENISIGDTAHDQYVGKLIDEYLNKMDITNGKIKENAAGKVKDSTIRVSFDKLLLAEKELTETLDIYKKKYGIEEKQNEASTSGSPKDGTKSSNLESTGAAN